MSLLGVEGADDDNRVVMPQLALDRISLVQVEYLLAFRSRTLSPYTPAVAVCSSSSLGGVRARAC